MATRAVFRERQLEAAEHVLAAVETTWRDEWPTISQEGRADYLENEIDEADRYLGHLQDARGSLSADLLCRLDAVMALWERLRPTIVAMEASLTQDVKKQGAA